MEKRGGRWLTTTEAGRLANADASTVRRWCAEGSLKGHPVRVEEGRPGGARWLIRADGFLDAVARWRRGA